MKADIAVSGAVGLVIGGSAFLATSWLSAYLPFFIQGSLGAAITFAVLLLIALAEMPMMVVAMRNMARSPSTPRGILLGTNAGYTAFASVYACIFVLATGQVSGGLALAALGMLRFVSGVFVK
ncbi:MAG: hypothetical protein HY782_06075 [Chloroflexi bacterium]|nr:hypothetical protein [Chloroflexota bacterium]